MYNILEVNSLHVDFLVSNKLVPGLQEISFCVGKNSFTTIIGETGSGKTITSRLLCGIPPHNIRNLSGSIMYMGKNLLQDDYIKRPFGLIMQNPFSSFSPTVSIGSFIKDILLSNNRKASTESIIDILSSVGIDRPALRLRQYPHELSGGMLQRIMVGINTTIGKDILICDEPTSALDLQNRQMVIELLKQTQHQKNTTILFITHDISLIENINSNIIVMLKGYVVEQGEGIEVVNHSRHPYTRQLILDAHYALSDNTHILSNPSKNISKQLSCPYSDYCHRAKDICFNSVPPFIVVGKKPTHSVRCYYPIV